MHDWTKVWRASLSPKFPFFSLWKGTVTEMAACWMKVGHMSQLIHTHIHTLAPAQRYYYPTIFPFSVRNHSSSSLITEPELLASLHGPWTYTPRISLRIYSLTICWQCLHRGFSWTSTPAVNLISRGSGVTRSLQPAAALCQASRRQLWLFCECFLLFICRKIS